MTMHYDVIIVGSGHSGAQAAIALRQCKFDGSIAVIGEEGQLPYERPPLSKDYLSGEKTFERLLIRPAAFWVERNITMLPGCKIVEIDGQARTLTSSDGKSFAYRKLIWAAGGYARRLSCSGHNLAGVHTVRTRADVDRIIDELTDATRVCVIGGGYVGLEAASALTKLGKKVTVLEAQNRLLARVAGVALSRFYEVEHRAHGVEVRLNEKVECIEEYNGRVAGVRLAQGELLRCEMVIVGIGIVPAVEPLIAAGAKGSDNGVVVDGHCRTNLPDVYAIGDCALHRNVHANDSLIRLESVQNANDMAAVAARSISGDESLTYQTVPWFWSNQFDLKLQTVGLSAGHDLEIVRGNAAQRSFSVVYVKAGRVVALDCVNKVKDYVEGRTLILSGTRPDLTALADANQSLKNIITNSPPEN